MIKVHTLKFNKDTTSEIRQLPCGVNWPVVYVINNNKEAYIGETTNFQSRTKQHLSNNKRTKLSSINVVSDDTFNKSSILDLESFLIKYMSADNKYKLQNGNAGIQNHNYYQKSMYEEKFKLVWKKFKDVGLVDNDLLMVENSDLFKYSPYKSLTIDQYDVVHDILGNLSIDVQNQRNSSFLVHGGAGTGKTILGIYLIKLLMDAKDDKYMLHDDETNDLLRPILENDTISSDFKIGIVIPMAGLRKTIKKVFKNIKGLTPKMVLSPHEIAKNDTTYDILIVDEAHRLRRRKSLANYGVFDTDNQLVGLGKDGIELDWILKRSKYQILFYDAYQSIRPSDIDKSRFVNLARNDNCHSYNLYTQLRCLKGGNEYIDYIKSLFSDTPPNNKVEFDEYDFKIFDDVQDMIDAIKEKDKIHLLCRNIAGFSWKWKTKNHSFSKNVNASEIEECVANNIYDIEIGDYKYIWNTVDGDWIHSKNAINEIGSIHTTQGHDLNYTGLIIGNELKYDLENRKLYVDKEQYHDRHGKAKLTDEELLNYILHIYMTMCTRGILGTYIYACDPGMQEYLRNYIDTWTEN